MTANQLERFARAHRQVTAADDAAARARRRLTWRVEEDRSLSGTFRLPPLAGAVLLKALRAARDLEDPRDGEHENVSAETLSPDPGDPADPRGDRRPGCGGRVTRWPRTLPYGRPYRMLAIHSAAASVSG